MEHHSAHVQHIAVSGAFRGLIFRFGRGILGAVIADSVGIGIGVSCHTEADGTSVGGADDIALHIRTVQLHIRITQAAQHRFCGMSVGIALSTADQSKPWRHRLQKGTSRGGV